MGQSESHAEKALCCGTGMKETDSLYPYENMMFLLQVTFESLPVVKRWTGLSLQSISIRRATRSIRHMLRFSDSSDSQQAAMRHSP
jgi:hypothetical protein